MKRKTLLTLALLSASFGAAAHNLSLGNPVPSVSVASYGEIVLQGKGTAFQPWASSQMLGKVRVIQAIAGRSSSKEMNAPLMQAITAAQFSADHYQTTTIINQDDAIWGTGSFVKSSAQDSKKEFPWSSMVLDENGVVASSWKLDKESSAIIVQDKQGKVLFVKEGALSSDDITQVLELIKANI
ncbi:YtfJ family protein [Vibrio vulnificus]|uniref:YtfJ family protein n=1 Tax=Vibrio vulnificus TaxID=672 RepID=UPI000B9FDE0D|nr:YtfJ family protein [Vibrio vulnificus]EGR8990197.1 YtfJ family protein [Vibrio vulnificus]EHU4977093.1 YtfJ family protein [Vibrio vulnificus]MCA0783665.1 YtfJ family protein [Vibrio vulnificus]MCG8705424.1 YtfJ family protein [Vibrio vulnificus]MCU8444452.1 YtfJ family protein [Vibrio vulnificus]